MPKLPILYKRTKTSAIQYWEIEVTQQEDYGVITKTSGQYGTNKPIENVEFVTEGKNLNKSNETTPMEQATSQAESDWKRKQDQGYKTMEALGVTWHEPTCDWVYNGEHFGFLNKALDVALPQYNSDAQGNPKPMLAQPLKWEKVVYPCFAQPKLDGVRCLAIFDGKEVTFLSRTGKEYKTLGHIETEIKEKATEPIILDGELYSSELSFQDIVAAVKKKRDDTLKIKYKVYDVVNDHPQVERESTLRTLISSHSWETLQLVPTFTCASKEEVITLHNHFIESGHEGTMVRLQSGLYEKGQRSRNLLKCKDFDTSEFPFVEFIFGQRGVEDLIARCYTEDGLSFRAKMQGTVEEKQQLFDNKPTAGIMLTVKHHGYTDANLPRFPIGITFRDYE